MTVVLIVLIVILGIVFVVAPSRGRGRMNRLREARFAHRGLYSPETNAAENCLRAFSMAAMRGYGVEMDVRFTKDKRLVIMHDDDLKRMCGADNRVDELTLSQLRGLTVKGTRERIPTFDEALSVINGRVPLCVEIKSSEDIGELSKAVRERLKSYSGDYVVESFDPRCVRWFRKNAPDVIRGQLVTDIKDVAPVQGFFRAFAMSCLWTNVLTRPDFVAYNVNAKGFFTPRIQKLLFNTPLLAWTVKSLEQYNQVLARGEIPIFEGFRPE